MATSHTLAKMREYTFLWLTLTLAKNGQLGIFTLKLLSATLTRDTLTSALYCLGSISAALSCLVYPPREDRLDA